MNTTDEADELADRLELFVARNFPQIQMHGGRSAVEAVDLDTGEVWVTLGGACSGCGISPMTAQALKSRMITEFDEVNDVHASTGMQSDPSDSDLSNVPF